MTTVGHECQIYYSCTTKSSLTIIQTTHIISIRTIDVQKWISHNNFSINLSLADFDAPTLGFDSAVLSDFVIDEVQKADHQTARILTHFLAHLTNKEGNRALDTRMILEIKIKNPFHDELQLTSLDLNFLEKPTIKLGFLKIPFEKLALRLWKQQSHEIIHLINQQLKADYESKRSQIFQDILTQINQGPLNVHDLRLTLAEVGNESLIFQANAEADLPPNIEDLGLSRVIELHK